MVINQPFGLGDIIFLEPLFRHYWKRDGVKPILPVRDQFIGIAEAFESVTMVPLSKSGMNIDQVEFTIPGDYLPLRFANQIFRGHQMHDHNDLENMMMDKYRLVGLDPMMWRSIELLLNEDKAYSLYKRIQALDGLGPFEKFIVINEDSAAGNIKISPTSRYKIVKMRPIDNYTVIDWWMMIYLAEENHHVSTSTFHLMQAIVNQYPSFAKKAKYIYPRPNYDGLRGISQLKPTFDYTPMM